MNNESSPAFVLDQKEVFTNNIANAAESLLTNNSMYILHVP